LESLWWGVCVLDKATDEAGNLDPGTSINAGNSPFIVRKEGTLYTHGRSDRYETDHTYPPLFASLDVSMQRGLVAAAAADDVRR
jgi:hypothetical protein